MTKNRRFIITEPVFRSCCVVLVGKLSWIKQQFEEYLHIEYTGDHTGPAMWPLHRYWVITFPGGLSDQAIVHEVSHLVDSIWDTRDTEARVWPSTEVRAYLMAYYYRSIKNGGNAEHENPEKEYGLG